MIHTAPYGKPQVFIRPFINFGVALFLFISGYLINVDSINKKKFYKKRIKRVLIPYFIWTSLYTIVEFIGSEFNLKKFIMNFALAKSAAMMYYIFVYIQFILLTPFLCKLVKSKYNWLGWLIAPLSVIIKYYWLFFKIDPNDIISSLYDVCCLGWFTYYYLGLYLKNRSASLKCDLKKLIIIYIITILLQILEGYGWYSFGNMSCGTQLKISSFLTGVSFIMIAYWYINNDKYIGKNRLLILVGDYSFGIYISHIIFINILNKIIPTWKQIPFVINSLIVLSISLLFVIIGKKILGEKIGKYIGLY